MIVLDYRAPDSPDARRGYVISRRDARGVVSTLRAADFVVPLKPGELRLQLETANGRWAVRRNRDHIRKLPDRKWLRGSYVEIRVSTQGWSVPVGIADQELQPVSALGSLPWR